MNQDGKKKTTYCATDNFASIANFVLLVSQLTDGCGGGGLQSKVERRHGACGAREILQDVARG